MRSWVEFKNTLWGKSLSVAMAGMLVISPMNVWALADGQLADAVVEEAVAPTAEPEVEAVAASDESSAEEYAPVEVIDPVIEDVPAPEPVQDAGGSDAAPAPADVESATTSEAEDAEVALPSEQQPEDGIVQADVSNPAFEGYAYVDGIVVKVTAPEGALPQGTQVQAYRVISAAVTSAVEGAVASTGHELQNATAIDVTLVDAAGAEVQPASPVNVCFFNAGAGAGEQVRVFHVADDASRVETVGTRQADANVQSFDVAHFSIYVVADVSGQAVVTYNFMVKGVDGYVLSSTQAVKTGEELLAPANPEAVDGQQFMGWFTAEEGGEEFAGFGTQGIIDASSEVNLYARYAAPRYVYFVDNNGVTVRTKESADGATVTTGDVTFPVADGYVIEGWYTEGTSERVDSLVLAGEDVTLHANVVPGNTLTFRSTGGSHVESQYVLPGSVTTEPAAPTRQGYIFTGWVESETEAPFSFGETLTSDVMLKATWTPGEAQYRVATWLQNPDDDGYSLDKAEWFAGVAEEQTAAAPGALRGFFAPRYEQQIIAGDGSTIVNVYYDRQTYAVRFFQRASNRDREIEELRITARYGANIADQWPSRREGSTWPSNWRVNPTGNTYQSGIGAMPLNGARFYLDNETGRYTAWARYEVSQLDGGYATHHIDKFPTNRPTSWRTSIEDFYDIEGFTYTGNVASGMRADRLYKYMEIPADADYNPADQYGWPAFRYDRNTYKVSFVNGSDQVDIDKLFEEPLNEGAANVSEMLASTPERPGNVNPDYVFAGWFNNPEGLGEPVTSVEGTMPSNNLVYYASWVAPQITATIHFDQDATSSQYAVETLAYLGSVTDQMLEGYEDQAVPSAPEGAVFMGWATREAARDGYVYTPFDTNAELTKSVELWPLFAGSKSSSVTYNANGGSGAVPVDGAKYAEGSLARVSEQGSVVAPTGLHFLGWGTRADGTGVLYYPGQYAVVNGDVVLYAQYAAEAPTTTIAYNNNLPSGDSASTSPLALANNAEHTVSKYEALGGFVVPDGYVFLGWSLTAAGEVAFRPGDAVRVDNVGEGANVLYAQWRQLPKDPAPTPVPTPKKLPKAGDPVSIVACGIAAAGIASVAMGLRRRRR